MLTGTFVAGALVDLHPSAPFAVAAACLALTFAVGLRFVRVGRPAGVTILQKGLANAAR